MASVLRKVRKEVVSVVSAATELVAETLSIVQKLVQAHRTIRGLSAILDCHRSQLARVQHVLEMIQAEPYLLNNPGVMAQVDEINGICKEVEEQIEMRERRLRVGRKGGAAGRYLRILLDGGRSEREMTERLERVGSSLAVLDAMIDVAQVEILRRVEESVMKTSNAVEKMVQVDADGRLEEHLSVSSNATTTSTTTTEGGSTIIAVDDLPLPCSSSPSISSDATTTTTIEREGTMIAVNELPPPCSASPSGSDFRSYFEVTAQGHAIQFNGEVGSIDWNSPRNYEYTRMLAKDNSVQINGPIDSTALKMMLAIRR